MNIMYKYSVQEWASAMLKIDFHQGHAIFAAVNLLLR